MMDRQQALAQTVLSDPDVESVASFIGADGTNATTNSGRLNITLKSRKSRKASADEIIHRLQPKLSEVEGIALYMQSVQDLANRQPREPHAISVHAGRLPIPTS